MRRVVYNQSGVSQQNYFSQREPPSSVQGKSESQLKSHFVGGNPAQFGQVGVENGQFQSNPSSGVENSKRRSFSTNKQKNRLEVHEKSGSKKEKPIQVEKEVEQPIQKNENSANLSKSHPPKIRKKEPLAKKDEKEEKEIVEEDKKKEMFKNIPNVKSHDIRSFFCMLNFKSFNV